MTCSSDLSEVTLPKGWTKHVQVALLHVVSLAHVALAQARGRAWQSKDDAAIDSAEHEVLRTEIDLLMLELRLKDERMARVDPRRRPHYRPPQRLEILTLKAALGWTAAETSERFHVDRKTVATVLRGAHEVVGSRTSAPPYAMCGLTRAVSSCPSP